MAGRINTNSQLRIVHNAVYDVTERDIAVQQLNKLKAASAYNHVRNLQAEENARNNQESRDMFKQYWPVAAFVLFIICLGLFIGR